MLESTAVIIEENTVMAERSTLNTIARIIVDAFDVDIHIYTVQLLRRLRDTPSGANFVEWAENNPAAFMNLLRGASVVVQRLPSNDNLVAETIVDHLRRLPIDIWETTASGRGSTSQSSFSDEEFRQKYEQATSGLSQNELAQVAKLRRSRLREWVNSPLSMNRASKAIVFWGISVAWLLINILFVDVGEFSPVEGDYVRNVHTGEYEKIEHIAKNVLRRHQGLPPILYKPPMNSVRWFSWRFLALYSLVFCPFYSVWVIYKAITR